jgi:CheY-like chemotaxis protein
MKIVVADDSAEMRRLIRSMLPKDTEVIECEDGQAALRAFREHAPQWVLLDIAMAPLDGISAAEQLRAMAPDARIIFVTAHDQACWRGVAQRLRACGYVLKDALEEINDIIASADPTSKQSEN